MRLPIVFAIGLSLLAGLLAGCGSEKPGGGNGPAAGTQAPEATLAEAFAPELLRVGSSYPSFVQITATASWAPVACVAPNPLRPLVDPGTNSGPHGRKLYFLYAINEPAYRKGGTQPVGQTIVKEAWHPRLEEPGQKQTGIYSPARLEGKTYVPGDKGPLFVMIKLDPQTPDTDGGWVYGTLTPEGDKVTAAGRLPSCMSCHEKGTQDRLFRSFPTVVEK